MALTSFSLRPALPGDTDELARLAKELGYPTAPEVMEVRLAALLPLPHHHVVVACRHDGNLVGWLHVEHRYSLDSGESAELMALVVDAAARRQGIGLALVEAAVSWARQRRLPSIRVRSNVLRRESHRFYNASGFMASKTQHVYVKPLATSPEK